MKQINNSLNTSVFQLLPNNIWMKNVFRMDLNIWATFIKNASRAHQCFIYNLCMILPRIIHDYHTCLSKHPIHTDQMQIKDQVKINVVFQ